MQVAAGVLGGLLWTLKNPKRGVCLPEAMPHDEILRIAEPYIGPVVSQPAGWTPLQQRRIFFGEHPDVQLDFSDPWQFSNFRFQP